MIDIKTIKESDVGRFVEYRAFPTAKPEFGKIISFNSRFIFVDWSGNGRITATNPDNLIFVGHTYDEIIDEIMKE